MEADRLLQQVARPRVRLRFKAVEKSQRSQHQIIGGTVLRQLAHGPPKLTFVHLRDDGLCHLDCHTGLQFKQFGQPAVVLIVSDYLTGFRVAEFCSDPQPFAVPSHTAVQYVPRAEFAADRAHVDRGPREAKGRGSRDDEQFLQSGQCMNDFLDDAVGDVGILWASLDIAERHHRDRRQGRPVHPRAGDRRSRQPRRVPRRGLLRRPVRRCSHSEDAYRVRDISKVYVSSVGRRQFEPTTELLANRTGDGQAAGFRQLL